MPAGCDGVVGRVGVLGTDGVVGADWAEGADWAVGADGCETLVSCAWTASGTRQAVVALMRGRMVRCFFKRLLAFLLKSPVRRGVRPSRVRPCGGTCSGIMSYARVLTNGSVGLVQ